MKPIPKKITKTFLFELYRFNDVPDYYVRNFINKYMEILGKNTRNKNVPKLIFYYLLIHFEHLTNDYELNENEKNELKKLGFNVFWRGYCWEIVKIS